MLTLKKWNCFPRNKKLRNVLSGNAVKWFPQMLLLSFHEWNMKGPEGILWMLLCKGTAKLFWFCKFLNFASIGSHNNNNCYLWKNIDVCLVYKWFQNNWIGYVITRLSETVHGTQSLTFWHSMKRMRVEKHPDLVVAEVIIFFETYVFLS